MPSDPRAKRSRRSIRLGKYEVVTHIATGGMGAVYKAIDTDLKREVALKVLTPELASKPAALERFRREAEHAAKLRHENIVTIYDFGHEGGTYYLALEFIDGIDLHEYINRKGRLDPEEARVITIQAARALDHAFKQGIVHRDIKPSNFLLTRKGETLVVKMSDFGLARKLDDEEARVTRTGTTVGTVDYMSPEQARDSGAADTRSDIYSLGCTLFHMLTGQAPFPEGSIPERLYKHANEPPPDLRQLNPRVSEALAAVVHRMLAKAPDDRYQTPAELLKDLIRVSSVASGAKERDVLAALAHTADEKPASDPAASTQRRRAPQLSRPALRRRGDDEETEPVLRVPAEQVKNAPIPWTWFAAGGAVVAVLGVIALVLALTSSPPAPPTEPDDVTDRRPGGSDKPVAADTGREPDPGPRKPPDTPRGPDRPEWPPLAERAAPIDKDRLWQEFLAPWQRDAEPPPGTPLFRFARLPAGHVGDVPSLEMALAAALPGQLTVIEVHDNGPIFLPSMAVTGRSIHLRAAKGYRPLLVWDTGARAILPPTGGVPAARNPVLLSVMRGSLTLEGLDVVLKWTDSTVPERPYLFRVTDGDFSARNCTFSVTGKVAAGIGLVRFDRSDAAGPPRSGGNRCRLSRCYARGGNLIALDLDAPGADVLLDGCLLVGNERPLVQVAGRNLTPTVLRMLRSTLIAGMNLLEIRPASSSDTQPQLYWRGWDTLLARGGTLSGGEMVALPAGGRIAAMKWQPVNCLYAGWKTLLVAADVTASDLRSWHACWQRKEGDEVVTSTWPPALHHDPAELLPATLRPSPAPASPVGFAATSGPGPLGCDLSALPPVRDNWLSLTGDSFPVAVVETLSESKPPQFPPLADGRYHGGRIDLTRTDLGAFLEQVQKSPGLGPRVVLHLAGTGEHKTSPVRVKGSTLVLYFLPSDKGTPTLVPDDTRAAPGEALIDVEGGGLEMIGGRVRFPDYRLALLPPYLLRVRGGDLHLFRCRLQGPLLKAPDAYRGLIRFEGSSEEEKPRVASLSETVLVSGKAGIHLTGTGARLRLVQCVAVAGTDALHLDPTEAVKPRLGVQVSLENTTVAARQTALRLDDAPRLESVTEPAVVQARECAFLNPFAEAPSPPTLLGVSGNALGRGLLVCQGEGCAFDKRLAREILALPPGSSRLPAAPAWARLWGSAWERRQMFDLMLTRTLDWDNPQLDRLAVPIRPPRPGEERKPPPGADLERLGRLMK